MKSVIRWLASFICLAAQVPAQDAGSFARPWTDIRLPVGEQEWIDVELGVDGELFVAAAEAVFLRSPYGEEAGWQRVPLPVPNGDEFGGVRDLALLQGTQEDVLAIVDPEGLALVECELDSGQVSPWKRFQPTFRTQRIDNPEYRSIRRVHSLGLDIQDKVRAWIEVDGMGLAALSLEEGRWALAEVSELVGAQAGGDWSIAHGSNWGASLGWTYGDSALYLLTDQGTGRQVADLAVALKIEPESQEFVFVNSAWVDASRELVFVGTSHGLAVGSWQPDGDAGITNLQPVASLGRGTVLDLGTTAGRLRVTVGDAESQGLIGGVVFERTFDSNSNDADFVAKHTFFSGGSGGPESPTAAWQLADDLVLVHAEDGLWEWSPGRWGRFPGSETGLRSVSPRVVRSRPGRPPVFLSLMGDRLVMREPSRPDGWHLHPSSHSLSVERFLPDTSGQGVWSCSQGLWCFETPHGSLAGELSVSGGANRLRVQELTIELPGSISWSSDASIQLVSGEAFLPESAVGGLLVPAGNRFVHLDAGQQTAVEWGLAEGVVLRSAIPVAASGMTGWMAIYEEGQGREVVHLDVEFGDDETLSLAVYEIETSHVPDHLFYDSNGDIWYGVAKPGPDRDTTAWSAVQVSAILGELGEVRTLGHLPFEETPRMLWFAPEEPMSTLDNLLFTDRGVLPAGHDGEGLFLPGKKPGAWIELFPSVQGTPWSRRFRGVRLPVQFAKPWSFNRRIVVLTEQLAPFALPRPSQAFALRVDEPRQALVPLNEAFGIEQDIQVLPLLVSRPDAGEDVLMLPGHPSSSAKSPKPSARLSTRLVDDIGTASPFDQEIRPMDGWSVGAYVPNSLRISGTGRVEFAGSDGDLVALRTELEGSNMTLPFVPQKVELHGSNGTQVFELPDDELPSEIPEEFHELSVHVVASHLEWWSTNYDLAYLDVNGSQVAFDEAGVARFSLDPDAEYDLSVTGINTRTGESTEWVSWSPKTEPRSEGLSAFEVVAITLGSIGSVLLLLLGVVRPLRRWALASLRRRHWAGVGSTPDFEIQWEDRGAEAAPRWRARGFREVTWGPWTQGAEWANAAIDEALPVGLSRRLSVLVEWERVPKESTRAAPAVLLDQDGNVHGVVGIQPQVVRPPRRPTLRKTLSAAVLAPDERGATFTTLRRELVKHGVRTKLADTASEELPIRFVSALAKHDLVIMTTEPDAAPHHLRASLESRSLRGRCLLIFSEAAAPSNAAWTWMEQVAPLGLHILWIPNVQDATAANAFRTQLIAGLFKNGWSGGSALGDSLVEALESVTVAEARELLIAGLILLGNPAFRWAPVSRHFAFVSHSSQDTEVVQWLHHRLRRGSFPLQHRRRICVDRESFAAGPLRQTVADNVAGSDWLVVCHSPASADSTWVEREIRQFLRDQPGDRLRLCDLVSTSEADEEFLRRVRRWSGQEEQLRPSVAEWPGERAEEAVAALLRELARPAG